MGVDLRRLHILMPDQLSIGLTRLGTMGEVLGKLESLRVFASTHDAPAPDSLEHLGNGLMVSREGAKKRRNER